jgi:hypothetical protein
MISSITIAIKQLFTAITVFFQAFEKLANTTNHLATWSEETAASFSDEARIMRIANRTKLLSDNKVSDATLALASNGGSTITPKAAKA